MDLKDQIDQCLKIGEEFPFMPLSNSNLPHPTIKNSVTFFGGSFDPFHQGHRACLELCPEENIILVLDRNPQKELRSCSPYDEYLKIKKALHGTKYFIYPSFLTSNKNNPTYSWLPFVKITEKNLLMGDDSFMNFLNWQSPEIILSTIKKLYVVPRNFSKKDYLLQKQKINNINPLVKIIFLDDHNYKGISSTKLR